jgi:hypothetical protein
MTTPKSTVNIHPKVLTGILTGVGVAALTGIATGIDPHLFDALGPYGPLVASGITIGASQFAAWLKKGPDSEGEVTQTFTPDATPSVVPAPEEPLILTGTPVDVKVEDA